MAEKAKSAMEAAYEKLEKVGQGAYGKVYRAREKATGKIVALKKTLINGYGQGVPPTTLREISLLRLLSRYPHIVKLMDVKQGHNKKGQTHLYLVFEYLDTDLANYIGRFYATGSKIPTHIVKSLMYQLCKGVAVCHAHGVLHRDIKPSNLLMDQETMTLKIGDLGLARAFTVPIKRCYSPRVMTIRYKAPELLLGAPYYTTALDMWSVGCVFAELERCSPLFSGRTEMEQIEHIFKLLGTPDELVWPGVGESREGWYLYPPRRAMPLCSAVPSLDKHGVDLLSEMLRYDPCKRISAKDALEHPYFDDLDKSDL